MANRSLSTLVFVVAAVLSGCAGPTDGTSSPFETSTGDSGTDAGPLQVFDWTGHIVASELEASTHHFRPEEDVMWPVSQAGILFSVDETPQAMEVALEWTGPGNFMIMLHSHKAHGTNVYVEHVTELDPENPKCLRVPAADLSAGVWQVMVHSRGAEQTDFTLHVGLVGGAGHIIEDDRHGHWRQDGGFDVDLHDIEPCQLLQPTGDAGRDSTGPTELPRESHFELGDALGCQDATLAGPPCTEFHAGPGGTGSSIDGHWIRLGQPYWGLVANSTIQQVDGGNDSDCVFTDAEGIPVGDPSYTPEPCTALVPRYAEWLFVYSYYVPATGMTVDFALPPADAPADTAED